MARERLYPADRANASLAKAWDALSKNSAYPRSVRIRVPSGNVMGSRSRYSSLHSVSVPFHVEAFSGLSRHARITGRVASLRNLGRESTYQYVCSGICRTKSQRSCGRHGHPRLRRQSASADVMGMASSEVNRARARSPGETEARSGQATTIQYPPRVSRSSVPGGCEDGIMVGTRSLNDSFALTSRHDVRKKMKPKRMKVSRPGTNTIVCFIVSRMGGLPSIYLPHSERIVNGAMMGIRWWSRSVKRETCSVPAGRPADKADSV